jgi:hypothetical protein
MRSACCQLAAQKNIFFEGWWPTAEIGSAALRVSRCSVCPCPSSFEDVVSWARGILFAIAAVEAFPVFLSFPQFQGALLAGFSAIAI